VVVISYRTIREFIEEYVDAEDSLNNWYVFTEKADWANFNELRCDFGSADAVGNDLYVFNIRGNRYRLVVRIIFKVRTVFIKFVGTHEAYDRLDFGKL
jgi:mRNA interferase HigB